MGKTKQGELAVVPTTSNTTEGARRPTPHPTTTRGSTTTTTTTMAQQQRHGLMSVFVLIAALLGVCATAQTVPARGKFGVFPDKNVAFPWTLLREGLIDDSFTNFAVAFADADGASEGFEVAGPFPYKYDYGKAKGRGRTIINIRIIVHNCRLPDFLPYIKPIRIGLSEFLGVAWSFETLYVVILLSFEQGTRL